jgi:hypothetical protein
MGAEGRVEAECTQLFLHKGIFKQTNQLTDELIRILLTNAL